MPRTGLNSVLVILSFPPTLRMRRLKGFFALFPGPKKCEGRWAGECGAGRARQLIHAKRSSNGSSRAHLDRRQWEPVEDGELGACWYVLVQHHYGRLPVAPAMGAGVTSPGRYVSTVQGCGWCLAVDVPEIMQRPVPAFLRSSWVQPQ